MKQGQRSKCMVAEGHLDDAQDARKSTVVGCPPCMTSLSPSRATVQYNHADLLTHCTPLQVAESIARKPVDFGRLVFSDLTTTRCAKSTPGSCCAYKRWRMSVVIHRGQVFIPKVLCGPFKH